MSIINERHLEDSNYNLKTNMKNLKYVPSLTDRIFVHRQLSLFGHVIRKDDLEGLVITSGMRNFLNFDLDKGYPCEYSRSGLIFWGGGVFVGCPV